jgi:hypothetical protein
MIKSNVNHKLLQAKLFIVKIVKPYCHHNVKFINKKNMKIYKKINY